MSEMTLEQVRDALLRDNINWTFFLGDGSKVTFKDMADAIDAHLTRAPGQVSVSDGEVDRAMTEIRRVLQTTNPSYACVGISTLNEWLELFKSLSARLAQPVVDVDERLRVILRERNHRDDGDTTTLLERVRHMSLGDRDCIAMNEAWHKNNGIDTKPHPQAAQGELSGNSGELPAYARCGCAECVNLRGGERDEPAECMAVPDGWVPVPRKPDQAMIDAGTAQHECEQGDSWYASPSLSDADCFAIYEAMLSAAPTLAVRANGNG